MKTYVIVGGVAGGATAATRLRRRDESAQIIILERGQFVSYANCGLPYRIGGVIEEKERLLMTTPEELIAEFNLDVRTGHEALAIDRKNKSVLVRNLNDGTTYTLPYDKLILSPGAMPIVPPIPGADLPGVWTLRTIPDTETIVRDIADPFTVLVTRGQLIDDERYGAGLGPAAPRIGVWVRETPRGLVVSEAFPGEPAYEAGLRRVLAEDRQFDR